MKLKFVDITSKNILLATSIQLDIFPNTCGYNSFLEAYDKGNQYWLVYDNDVPVGISGLYVNDLLNEKDTVWLGWFGVLEKYRNKGFGK